jgi:hypothetical protein
MLRECLWGVTAVQVLVFVPGFGHTRAGSHRSAFLFSNTVVSQHSIRASFGCLMVLRLPDGTQVARWYSGCPMVLRMPHGTQVASWCSGCLEIRRLEPWSPKTSQPRPIQSVFTKIGSFASHLVDRGSRVLNKKRRNKGQVLRYSLFSLTAILLLRRTRGGRGPALASSYPHATYSKFRHDILG